MTLLPQYRQDDNCSETETNPVNPEGSKSIPLQAPGTDINDTCHDVPAPAYPPRFDDGDAQNTGNSTRHNVTYMFVPRWPMEDVSQESALGVLGTDKAETIAIVQRGLPALAAFPAHRIEFYSQHTGQVDFGGRPVLGDWSRILDEAWPSFRDTPPKTPKVQLADLPGDAKRREDREASQELQKILWSVVPACFALMVSFALMGVAIWHCNQCEENKKECPPPYATYTYTYTYETYATNTQTASYL
ncbi:hypothetical protein IAT40_006708 [Kwoniella sp. CBS 6097]